MDKTNLNVDLTADGTGLKKGLADASAATKKFAADTKTAMGAASAATESMGAAAAKTANQTEDAAQREEKAIKRQEQARARAAERFIRDLEKQAAALGKTQAELMKMRAAELGISDRANPLIDRLNATDTSMVRVGKSARETARAMQMLPAQITDVVTSLATGMPIWMVAIQQGGQIKDSFGGIGAAMRAMASMISPTAVGLGVVGGAAAALGVAAFQGYTEVQNLNTALIANGNIGRLSADGIGAAAERVGELTGAYGTARDAAQALAASGKVSGEMLETVLHGVVAAAELTGESVEDMAEDFADLAKEPAEAVAKLNEKYNFLTYAVYEQIKALEEQGRETEAINLAQSTYAQAAIERQNRVKENLGTLERAWNGVWGAAKGAWDAMMDVGRPETLAEKENRAADLEATLLQVDSGSAVSASTKHLAQFKRKELRDLYDQINAMRNQQFSDEVKAEAQAAETRRINADRDLKERGKEFMSRKQLRDKEIEETKRLAEEAKWSDEKLNDRIKAINEKWKDPKGRTSGSASAQANELATLRARIQAEEELAIALAAQGAAASDLTEGEKLALVYAEKAKVATDAKTKAHWKEAEALAAKWGAAERANDATEETIKQREKYFKDGEKEIETILEKAQALEDENAAFGLTKDTIQKLTIARLEDRKALLQQMAAGKDLSVDAEREIAQINRKIDAYQRLGVATAANEVLEKNKRATDATVKELEKGIDRVGDAFVESFQKGLDEGENVFDSFADSIGNSLRTTLAQALYEATYKPVVVQFVAQLAGLLGGQSVQNGLLEKFGMGGQPGMGSNIGIGDLVSAGKTLYGSFTNGATTVIGAAPPVATVDLIAGTTTGGLQGAGAGAAAPWASGLGSWFSNAPASSMFSLGGAGAGTAAGAATMGIAGVLGGIGGSMLFDGKYAGMGGSLGATAGMAIGTSAAVGGTALGAQLGSFAGPLGAIAGMIIGSALGDVLSGGEKRFGGSYYVGDIPDHTKTYLKDRPSATRAVYEGGPSGGDPMAATSEKLMVSTYATLAEAAKTLGGTLGDLALFGSWEVSPDKGNSFVRTILTDGTQDLFDKRVDLKGEKDPEKVYAAFQRELPKLIIAALQRSDLDDAFDNYLDRIDVSKLDEAGVQQVLANLNAMLQFRETLARLPFADLAGIALEAGLKLAEFSGGIDALLANMQTYYDLVYSEEEKVVHMQQQLTEAFAKLGYELPKSAAELRALVEGLDTTTDAGLKTRAEVYALAGAFGQLQEALARLGGNVDDAAAIANAAFEAQLEKVKELGKRASELLATRNRAGNTLDQIDEAMGRTGQFAGQREAELWAAMSTASYAQQIELAGELTTLVLDRYDTEIASLQRLRDLGASLRSYVEGLRVGDLSPGTLGERLAEAAGQYADLLAKAKTGDVDAMAGLQGAADAYLRLARDYYASSDHYARIFDSVTDGLEELGLQAENTGDEQIGLSQSQLAELQGLRSVVQTAYDRLDAQYQAALESLSYETQSLVELGVQTGRLNEIASLLGTLPAQIAAALQPLLNSGTGKVVGDWYADAGRGQGDAAGVDYWKGELEKRPQEQVKDSFDWGLIVDWYRSYLGREPSESEVAYWHAELKKDGNAKTYERFKWGADIELGKIPGFAKGGFASGMAMVGEKGPELVDFRQPGRVYTNEQLGAAMFDTQRFQNRDNNETALLDEVRSLRMEVVLLREQNNRGHALNIQATEQAGQATAKAPLRAQREAEFARKNQPTMA